RVVERVRVPAEEHERRDQQHVPAVALAAEEPRHRDRGARHRSADDRRLRADCHQVGEDRDERAEMAPDTVEAEGERHRDDAGCEQHDVLAGHGEQVQQPGAPERVLQAVGEAVLVPEQHALDDGPPLTSEPGRRGAAKPPAEPVGDAADPAAVTDDLPAVDRQDDVDTLAAQPRSLVEAVLRPPGGLHDRKEPHDRPLRRRAAERQLELDALVESHAAKRPEPRELARDERSRTCLGGRDGNAVFGPADLAGERAPVERVEPCAPPPAPEPERDRCNEPEAPDAPRHRERPGSGDRGEQERSGTRQAHDVRERQPDNGGAGHDVRGQDAAHGMSSPFHSASRAGPMPGIASSSSIERKAPCCCRYATIFCAVVGPTPGSASSCSAVAAFSEIGADGVVDPSGTSPDDGADAVVGTSTCSPSDTGAARSSPAWSAFAVSPPARATASATRAPCSRWIRPGSRTAPSTSTTTEAVTAGRTGAAAGAAERAGAAAGAAVGARPCRSTSTTTA